MCEATRSEMALAHVFKGPCAAMKPLSDSHKMRDVAFHLVLSESKRFRMCFRSFPWLYVLT